MRKPIFWILIPAFLSLIVSLLPSNAVDARPAPLSSYASAFDIIVAVNDLRASYGLPAYNVSSILMGTAQSQAEFMASTGTVTHSGPGGISLTQRLINAGYSMAGGFRAENILSANPDSSGYDIVHSSYWADADHQNTMLSPNLSEIGAGVAVAGGRGYYVIDCAQPSGAQSSSSGSSAGSSATKGPSQILIPVAVNTPDADGRIYHEVQYGQSLWSIAIAYETKIDEIKRLNNLSSNDIYLGQKLLVKIVGTATPTIPMPTKTPTIAPATQISTQVPVTETMAITTTAVVPGETSPSLGGGLVVGIILVAILTAGVGAWLGMKRPL